MMDPGLVALVVLALFLVLLLLRVPIAFALLLACLPFFILAAAIMNASQVTERLIVLAQALIGWIRGGLGITNVATSMGFGGVSGSSNADVAGLGSVLIPQMARRGYPVTYAVGVTAASSVIGSTIPPSIQMVVWGSLTGTSIGALFLAGAVPGLLIGAGMMVVAYVIARRNDFPREQRPPLRDVMVALRDSLLALAIIVIVLGGILGGFVTATEAAVIAVLYALFLGLVVYRTLSLRDLPKIFRDSALFSVLPLFALAAAGALAYLIAYYRIPEVIQGAVEGVPAWAMLWVVAAVFLILGIFLDALPAMAIMVPVLAPAADAAGLDPVHYGVVAVMSLAMGLITPPYGLCLLLAAKIGEVPVLRAVPATVPFGLVILGVIALVILVPSIALWLPGLVEP